MPLPHMLYERRFASSKYRRAEQEAPADGEQAGPTSEGPGGSSSGGGHGCKVNRKLSSGSTKRPTKLPPSNSYQVLGYPRNIFL